MKYIPIKPSFLGRKVLRNIEIKSVLDYIDWIHFFNAWKISGNYKNIETLCGCEACKQKWLAQFAMSEREKAKEAFDLFMNAREILNVLVLDKNIKVNAIVCFYKAQSELNKINIFTENNEIVSIPTLRQQNDSINTEYCYSLSDFISPREDYIGVFGISVSNTEKLVDYYRKRGDDYSAILVQTLSDRIVEATSEWLHLYVRKVLWGYSEEENFSREELFKSKYSGIRPAVGYPSLPDQSIIFILDRLLHLEDINVTLTENGAMSPNSSVCGLYIAHPKSFYFMINKISKEQFLAYSQERKFTIDEMKKFIGKLFY